jgi:hypothetical protein
MHRIQQGEERRWESRGHFFVAAALAVRRILTDNARRKLSGKHCGGLVNRRAGPDNFPGPERRGHSSLPTNVPFVEATRFEPCALLYLLPNPASVGSTEDG